MSLFRRSMMFVQSGGNTPTADSYIQSGLVFQLDGIEKGSSSTQWTDRKGGIGFPYIAATSEVQTDSVHFTGSGYLTGDALITPSFTYDSMTIEVCCTYDNHNTGNRVLIVCDVAPNFAFGFANNKKDVRCASGTNKPLWSLTDMSGMKVYSITSDHALANINVSLTKGTNAQLNNSSGNIELGGRSYSASGYVGDVYAIRIYNRQLTLAEMAYNQGIDNQRFSLGL